MSIIYSYPTFGTATGSDLLLASRFDNEPGGPARTINLSLDTIGSYISTNHASTLNQVLTAGNESLLDAKVGGVYLYNVNAPSGNGYTYITGNKNRFNFYNNVDFNLANLAQSTLTFIDPVVVSRQFQIGVPSGITANRIATFQDASGTIAYLSDITSISLNQVLTAGNESLLNAKIGQLYLWDNLNNQYSTIRITDSAFIIEGIQGITGPLLQIEPGILNLKASGNFTGSLILSGLTDNRNYALPNKSGTIALTSDIPTYGLATLTTNCIPVSNTTTELTLLNGTIVGTLTLPANSLIVGDSFKLSLGGLINTVSPAQLFISIKTAAGTILGETGAITIASTCTGKKWSLEATLIIRAIGAATLGTSASSGIFSFKEDSISSISGTTFASVNSSTFDTTIENSLVVTARWATAIPGNLIYTQTFTLNKVY